MGNRATEEARFSAGIGGFWRSLRLVTSSPTKGGVAEEPLPDKSGIPVALPRRPKSARPTAAG